MAWRLVLLFRSCAASPCAGASSWSLTALKWPPCFSGQHHSTQPTGAAFGFASSRVVSSRSPRRSVSGVRPPPSISTKRLPPPSTLTGCCRHSTSTRGKEMRGFSSTTNTCHSGSADRSDNGSNSTEGLSGASEEPKKVLKEEKEREKELSEASASDGELLDGTLSPSSEIESGRTGHTSSDGDYGDLKKAFAEWQAVASRYSRGKTLEEGGGGWGGESGGESFETDIGEINTGQEESEVLMLEVEEAQLSDAAPCTELDQELSDPNLQTTGDTESPVVTDSGEEESESGPSGRQSAVESMQQSDELSALLENIQEERSHLAVQEEKQDFASLDFGSGAYELVPPPTHAVPPDPNKLPRRKRGLDPNAEGLAVHQLIAEVLDRENAQDVCMIELPESVGYVKYFIICTGTATRHIKTMAEELSMELKAVAKLGALIDGKDCSDWIAVDIGQRTAVVHLMTAEARDMYELEKLWTLGSRYDDQTREMEGVLTTQLKVL